MTAPAETRPTLFDVRLSGLDVIDAVRGLWDSPPRGAREVSGNPEYTRALVEVTCDLLGFTSDDKPAVAALLFGGLAHEYEAFL